MTMTSQSPSDAKKKTASKRSNFELTMPDAIVLSLLSERAMHGYELMREFEQQEVTEWANISRPHVYYALQKLARFALIKQLADKSGPSPGREKVIYQATALGKRALSAELSRMDWASAKSPPPFYTWYGLSIHTTAVSRQKILAARAAFLTTEIDKKIQTLEFIRSYDSTRAHAGLDLVQLYINQCKTELEWLAGLQKDKKP